MKEDTIISSTFQKSIMPYAVDIGKVILTCSFIYAAYSLMRKQHAEGVERIKWAMIGYAVLKGIGVFLKITDKATDEMLKRIGE